MLGQVFWTAHYGIHSNPSNYKNPIKSRVVSNTPNYQLVTDSAQVVTLNLMEIDFTSDNGFLFTSEKSQSALDLQDPTLSYDQNAQKDESQFVQLQMSADTLLYRRSSDKIQDVLAEVSGVMGTFIIFLGFLLMPFTKDKMFELIVNKVCRVQIQTRAKPNKEMKKKKKKNKRAGISISRETVVDADTEKPLTPEGVSTFKSSRGRNPPKAPLDTSQSSPLDPDYGTTSSNVQNNEDESKKNIHIELVVMDSAVQNPETVTISQSIQAAHVIYQKNPSFDQNESIKETMIYPDRTPYHKLLLDNSVVTPDFVGSRSPFKPTYKPSTFHPKNLIKDDSFDLI